MEGNRAQFYVPFTKKRNSQIGTGGGIDIADIGELSLLGMNRTDENVKRHGQSAENSLPHSPSIVATFGEFMTLL